MTPMESQQKINERWKKLLEETLIDFKPSDEWYEKAYEAMNFASPQSMGILAKDWQQLGLKLMKRSKLTYYEFATAANNLQSRSPRDLRLLYDSYVDLQIETEDYSKMHNDQAFKMKEKVVAEVIQEANKENNQNGLKPQ